MRREELVMDILGELDDKLLTEAMPRSTGKAAVSAAEPVKYGSSGKGGEVTKKELRIYMTFRALGIAAAVVLVVGAAVLLWQNWDRIAVTKEPDRPGVITTTSEPSAVSSTEEHGILYTPADTTFELEDKTVHITGYEFDRLWCKLYMDITFADGEPERKYSFDVQIAGNDEPAETASRFDVVSVSGNTASYTAEVFDLKSAKATSQIIFREWDGSGRFSVFVKYSDMIPSADIAVNKEIPANSGRTVALETISVCPYMFGFIYSMDDPDDMYELPPCRVMLRSGEELPVFTNRGVGSDSGRVFMQVLTGYPTDLSDPEPQRINDRIVSLDEIATVYVGDEPVYDTDRFERITDTSMPVPFDIDAYGGSHEAFSSQWVRRFSNINTHVRYAKGISNSERADEIVAGYEAGILAENATPYQLDDNVNLYRFINDYGLSSELVASALEASDEAAEVHAEYSGDGEEMIFTDEEIKALTMDDREQIAKLFASEYSIVMGENVFSPQWLYYHTLEDYQAAGITPNMIYPVKEKYQELGLTEEAWRAFRKKLVLHANSNFAPEKDRVYTYETDICEPLDDRAFEIFEKVFYGEWEVMKDYFGNALRTLSMTYSGAPYPMMSSGLRGIYETDEIWLILENRGGAGGCYVIEKSDPDVMYSTDIMPSTIGVDVVKLGDDENLIYYNRRKLEPELKTGELSKFGLAYLINVVGQDFGTLLYDTINLNGYVSFDDNEILYIGSGYTLVNTPWYLVEMSENTVVLDVPFVRDQQQSDQEPVYYELRFEKNEADEWSVEHKAIDGLPTVAN